MKNKMIGNYSNEGVLNISATNLQEFESLIKKAKKQADELQDTINQLEFFNFSFMNFGRNFYECFLYQIYYHINHFVYVLSVR